MSCLALRRGKGLAPPLTEILANCQDLFLIFEFSLIFNQGPGGGGASHNHRPQPGLAPIEHQLEVERERVVGGWRVWTVMEEGYARYFCE